MPMLGGCLAAAVAVPAAGRGASSAAAHRPAAALAAAVVVAAVGHREKTHIDRQQRRELVCVLASLREHTPSQQPCHSPAADTSADTVGGSCCWAAWC